MAKLVIYRDDYEYPIYAGTFEEMREKRSEGNRSFMSHGYGSVAYDSETHKYYNIYTQQEVPASERYW
jgi:hypothetical protein